LILNPRDKGNSLEKMEKKRTSRPDNHPYNCSDEGTSNVVMMSATHLQPKGKT